VVSDNLIRGGRGETCGNGKYGMAAESTMCPVHKEWGTTERLIATRQASAASNRSVRRIMLQSYS
jgi:hypothetical protein